MSLCPQCQQSVQIPETHYGALYTCEHCGHGFFVSWTGQPETTTANPQPSFEPDSMIQESSNSDLGAFVELPLESEPKLTTDIGPINSEYNNSSFTDVTEFANADQPIGSLNYTVEIYELEDKYNLQSLSDILNDSRFGWNTNELLKNIQNGSLIIENLNPVKTSVLISRLKLLNLKVRFKQNHF